jgi:hypothetical protein
MTNNQVPSGCRRTTSMVFPDSSLSPIFIVQTPYVAASPSPERTVLDFKVNLGLAFYQRRQRLPDGVAALRLLAGLRDQRRIRLVKDDQALQVAGVERFLEQRIHSSGDRAGIGLSFRFAERAPY